MPNYTTNIHSIIDFYNSIADTYDDMYQDDISKMEDRFMRDYLIKKVSWINGERFGNILDIGCGTGWVLDHFPKIPKESYYGADPSEGMITRAERKHVGYDFTVKNELEISRNQYRWADVILLLFGVGSHVRLNFFLERLFSVSKEQEIVIMFISGRKPCRAGLDIIHWEPIEIINLLTGFSSQIRSFEFRGLTNSELTHWDTNIEDAYSWILTIDKCRV